ncbi:hypothetical protein PARPLA_02681 [Rhodobacteraceae bacterium THAF1]|nr:hypothetical protein FIU81_08305 [Palleronia sp. THAF1]VDC28420.1 hypothetical protein PARPLA_02681 [Rhodobacteraceae bacterium THAF1]
MYRWEPGYRTTVLQEPAPSEMLKATGISPTLEGQYPPVTAPKRGEGV